MSYLTQPAKNESMIESTLSFAAPFNCFSITKFIIDGLSTIISQLNCPDLVVSLYVYIGSGLPKKWVGLKLGLLESLNFKLYGGNHITLPPFGPFSHVGNSS